MAASGGLTHQVDPHSLSRQSCQIWTQRVISLADNTKTKKKKKEIKTTTEESKREDVGCRCPEMVVLDWLEHFFYGPSGWANSSVIMILMHIALIGSPAECGLALGSLR